MCVCVRSYSIRSQCWVKITFKVCVQMKWNVEKSGRVRTEYNNNSLDRQVAVFYRIKHAIPERNHFHKLNIFESYPFLGGLWNRRKSRTMKRCACRFSVESVCITPVKMIQCAEYTKATHHEEREYKYIELFAMLKQCKNKSEWL